jgi:hypothetical protein
MDQFAGHPLYKRHTIDTAMGSLWEFYKQKFIPLFLMSLVMAFITQYASSMINFGELQSISDPEVMLLKLREYIWPMVILSVLSLLFITILEFYVIYNPVSPENNIPRSIVRSLRYFVPYLIIMILFAFVGSFVIFLGILALVVGVFFAALYLATIYFFILPVMIAEGPNIASTISRTMRLAHRKFWPNLGWSAVFILIMLVTSIVLSGLVLLPFTGSFLKVITDAENANSMIRVASNPLFIILSGFVNALLYPLLPIFSAILYFNGRAGEDQMTTLKPPQNNDDGRVKIEDLYSRPPENGSSDSIS